MNSKSKSVIFAIIVLIAVLVIVACDAGSNDEFGPLVDGKSYKLGDPGPEGGIIFYVSQQGFTVEMVNPSDNYIAYYLEAALEDTFGLSWAGVEGNLVPGLSETVVDETDWALGRGRKNTAIIIAYGQSPTPPQDPFSTPAAKYCAEYGSSNDWFLPSRNELNLLYTNKDAAGIIDMNSMYWSSSQSSNNSAWDQDFSNGDWNTTAKASPANVRAIRAFGL